MTPTTSWESLPPEIVFMILKKLPLKSQVSLACTCRKFYIWSLDPFFDNLQKRVWIYVEAYKPVPDLLAKAITILRIPIPEYNERKPENRSAYLKKQICRMSNLQKLILEKNPNTQIYYLPVTAIQKLVREKDLEELKVPADYLTYKSRAKKKLLHLAVEKGNAKLVNCLLLQMKVYFDQEGKNDSTNFSKEINLRDAEGYTPLEIASRQRNEEVTLLLLKKGARGKEYCLSKKNSDLSPIMQDTIDKGSHLHIEYLSPKSFKGFFEAIAESRHLVSLSFSQECYRELQKKSLAFFQNFGEALQRNFHKNSPISSENGENLEKSLGILLLDLRCCEVITPPEIKPLLTCSGIKELLLPRSLIDHVDACNQNFLHLLVQERSAHLSQEIAASFIAQGVALTTRDHQGHTPAQLAHIIGLQTGNQEMAAFLEQAAKRKLHSLACGKKEWEKYYGKVGKEPPLPDHILEIFESPCPIWPDKKIQETHFLTLIPERVNGKPLTLNYLQDLIKNPKGGGNKTRYIFYEDRVRKEHGLKSFGASYWVLMTKDVLPNTCGYSYDKQLTELNTFAARAPKIMGLDEYRPPKALEAATSVLMEYVRSGIKLCPAPENDICAYTYCEETIRGGEWRVVVGNFGPLGLEVAYPYWGDKEVGLGGLRKCYG